MSEISIVKTSVDAQGWFENELIDGKCNSNCPQCNSYQFAIEALREKLARDNPPPLTLEQLKEREGMPVWVSGKTMFGNQYAEWKVVSLHTGRDDAISFESGTDLLEKNYGKTWIAYDHKPKGEGK